MLTCRYLFLLSPATLMLVSACGGEDVAGVPARTLEISVATSGDQPDPDGYTLQVDAEPARPIQPSGVLEHHDLSPGEHTLYIGGVADNCAVQGANPRTINVAAEGRTAVEIHVMCEAPGGSVLVTTRIQGPLPYPNGHTIALDGTELAAIDTGTAVIRGISPGRHVVQLRGVAPHCTSQGNPRTVSVNAVEITRVEFFVVCVGPHGVLEITTSPLGYQNPVDFEYRLDGGTPSRLPSSSSVTEVVNSGQHLVELLNVPQNCRVFAPNPFPVEVPAGGRARVNFTIHCDPFAPGALAVSVSTSGTPSGFTGYQMVLNGDTRYQMRAVDRVLIGEVQPGFHLLTLLGVPANCRVDGEVTRQVSVPVGATAEVQFTVICTERA